MFGEEHKIHFTDFARLLLQGTIVNEIKFVSQLLTLKSIICIFIFVF